MINRSMTEALIPEDASREIFKEAGEQSVALRLMRRLPDMVAGARRLPVLSALPMAYFVDGTPEDLDSELTNKGYKATTSAEWENKYIYAEEIAAIIPIAISTLEDTAYDIWGELRPHISAALGQVIDKAILFGTGAPATWPTGIVPGAIAAGNSVALGVNDLYDVIMDETGIISLVEQDGFFPTAHVAGIIMRGRLRGLRDINGQPIFKNSMQSGSDYLLDGETILFPMNGGWDITTALMMTGDWTKAVYSIRTDATYKMLDQAVIQDLVTGEIIYNLAQQDMVALRVYMRLGWQLPNPVNRMNETAATRYPFAALTP